LDGAYTHYAEGGFRINSAGINDVSVLPSTGGCLSRLERVLSVASLELLLLLLLLRRTRMWKQLKVTTEGDASSADEGVPADQWTLTGCAQEF